MNSPFEKTVRLIAACVYVKKRAADYTDLTAGIHTALSRIKDPRLSVAVLLFSMTPCTGTMLF
jgi:hypothetical protein